MIDTFGDLEVTFTNLSGETGMLTQSIVDVVLDFKNRKEHKNFEEFDHFELINDSTEFYESDEYWYG